MKRIVRGNDFTMRIPVVKIVEGEKVAFPLPGCTDIMVRLCSAYRRLELAYTIDAKEDNVIVARVEGDRIPLGTYALEVRGKIFGNDWRSNEYEQVAIVDRNADADTELGNTDEGEDSVEMDTAVVILPPDRELDALVKEALAQNKAMSELSDAIKASEEGRTKSEELRAKSEEARQEAEKTRASTEAERKKAEQVRENSEGQRVGAEQGRASAESARVTAESARVDAENTRVTAEGEREQGFTEKAAHLEELLQYIKDNHLEADVKLAEAIKNAIKGTDVFVYLDANDGNVKSMPNTERLALNAASVYYAGKRSAMPGEHCFLTGGSGNKLIRSLDLSGWDFEAAADMSLFLYAASNLKTLTLPDNMTLANVKNMNQSFFACGSLQSLDTSKWTLANVTDMSFCFYNCKKIREIDLSSCNITKCVLWDGCFTNLYRLETLRIGLIDFSLCGSIDLFRGTNIRELTGTLRGIRNDFRAVSSRMTRDSCMVVINGLEMVTETKTLTLGVNNKPVSLGGKGSDPISDDDLKIATDKGWTVQFE